MTWYDPGYAYRRAVTVDNTGLSTALGQFQVQISLTSANFDFTVPLTDGSDLRVTDSDQVTLIPYWVQSYDHVAQTATIWVRVPSIAASSTHTIYLYYGNPTPATFTLPPTGKFARPATSVHSGLAENMVYDAVTNKYYVVYETLSNTIAMSSATSPAGPWTDLGLVLGVSGSGWDSGVVYAPHLFLDSGIWYLYYTGGITSPNGDSIGYATASSVTGPYTKAGVPVISQGAAGTWNAARSAECYVYHSTILSAWVCMFMGDSTGGGSPTETVGYATASAPTGPWTLHTGNPVLPLGSAPGWDQTEVADPWVAELDGVAYVGYCGTQQGTGAGITGYAVTTDYVTFTKVAPIAGWGVSNADWDNFDFFRGGPLLVSGTWYLPYTGNTIAAQSGYAWGVASMPAVSTAQGYDPWCVLDFFDDFPGTSLDSAAWGESTAMAGEGGSHSVAGSAVTLTIATAGGAHTLAGKRQWGPGYVLEARAKFPDFAASDTGAYSQLGLGYDDGSTIFIAHDYDATNWALQTHYGSTYNNGTLASAADQAYHTFSVAWKEATHCDFRVDGGTAVTEPVSVAAGSLRPWLQAQSIGGASESLVVDWVRVRKYAATDPSVSVGSQTSNGTGTTHPVTLAATSASAALLVKQAGKLLAVSGTSAAALTKQTGKTLAGTSSGSAALTKQTGKGLPATSTSLAGLNKRVGKGLAATASSAAALTALKVALVTLAATSASAAGMQRTVGKTLVATATSRATLTKLVRLTLAATSASNALLDAIRTIAGAILPGRLKGSDAARGGLAGTDTGLGRIEGGDETL